VGRRGGTWHVAPGLSISASAGLNAGFLILAFLEPPVNPPNSSFYAFSPACPGYVLACIDALILCILWHDHKE
jgi:hypothetical protein